MIATQNYKICQDTKVDQHLRKMLKNNRKVIFNVLKIKNMKYVIKKNKKKKKIPITN